MTNGVGMCREQEDFGCAQQVMEAPSLCPIIGEPFRKVSANAIKNLRWGPYSRLSTCFSCYSDCLDIRKVSLRMFSDDGRRTNQGIDLYCCSVLVRRLVFGWDTNLLQRRIPIRRSKVKGCPINQRAQHLPCTYIVLVTNDKS